MVISFLFFLSIGVWAIAIVITKFSTTATSLSINHSLGIHLTIVGALACIVRSDEFTMPTPAVLIFDFFVIGLPQFIAQLLYIHGTIVAKDPGMHALTNYVLVVLAYIH